MKNSVREAPHKEALRPKLLNYRLYVDLAQKITELMNCVISREPIVKVDDEINEINNTIKFMNNKKVSPRCKPLEGEPSTEQFITDNSDEGTMTMACQVLSDNTPDEQIIAEWRRHMEAHRKSKYKHRMFDQMNTKYANPLTSFKIPQCTYGDPKTNSETSFTPSLTSSETK